MTMGSSKSHHGMWFSVGCPLQTFKTLLLDAPDLVTDEPLLVIPTTNWPDALEAFTGEGALDASVAGVAARARARPNRSVQCT
jgi:hypothetical protein